MEKYCLSTATIFFSVSTPSIHEYINSKKKKAKNVATIGAKVKPFTEKNFLFLMRPTTQNIANKSSPKSPPFIAGEPKKFIMKPFVTRKA